MIMIVDWFFWVCIGFMVVIAVGGLIYNLRVLWKLLREEEKIDYDG